ncbi:hypothetical protein TELCIR_23239 [Teladorsagia circumcincta]|uniref:Phosphatidylinositol-4,5-bisphosphate 4-phosphatase n=1 Tax=Teladorsagia circumcincta TaxID=45464 RepID=A0A2G9TBR6_TELCI|nr:hypothetical protein TELCIR_23239 [Teladorsagia circumcincta]
MDREGGGNENVPLLRDDQRGQSYLEGGRDELEATHRGSVENVDDAGERRPTGHREPQGSAIRAPAGSCRVQCVHCSEVFLFNTLSNCLAHCPHCKKKFVLLFFS